MVGAGANKGENMASKIGDQIYPFIIKDRITNSQNERFIQAQKETQIRYENDPERDKHKTLYLKANTKEIIFKPFHSGRKTWILCECMDCHTLHWMFDYNLYENHAQSCPICKQPRTREDYTRHYEYGKRIKPRPGNDLRGRTFNYLFVLDDEPFTSSNGHSIYNCLCLLCQKTVLADSDDLKDNRMICCPNCSTARSHLETITALALDQLNILYEPQFKPKDLRGLKNGQMSFDFKIKDKPIIIECQGKQHYMPVSFFDGEKCEGFKIRQAHDKIKKEWCKKNNYVLLEIPYNCKDITKFLIENLTNN